MPVAEQKPKKTSTPLRSPTRFNGPLVRRGTVYETTLVPPARSADLQGPPPSGSSVRLYRTNPETATAAKLTSREQMRQLLGRLAPAVLLGILAFTLVLVVTDPPGPGLDPDAMQYMGAAESLAAQGAYRIPSATWTSGDNTSPLAVIDVVPGSPAEGKIEKGDVVAAITNSRRPRPNSAIGPVLYDQFAKLNAGDTVRLRVTRVGLTRTVVVRLGSLSDPSVGSAFVPDDYTISVL